MNEEKHLKNITSKHDIQKLENIHMIFLEKIEANKIEDIYNRVLETIKGMSIPSENKTLENTLLNLVDLLIETVSSQDELLLIFTGKTFDEDYIFAHSLNVCLISIRIGLRLGFSKDRIKVLGFLAIIHACKDMGLPENLREGFTQEAEMTEIIRLADVYDAMTHPPSYRKSIVPYETLTSIMHTHTFFNPELTKVLLKEISLYPRGSWVKLSTEEIGKVIKVNKGQTMQPTVAIFIDPKGYHLKEKKIVDLSQNNFIYIKQPLSEEEIMQMQNNDIIASSYQ